MNPLDRLARALSVKASYPTGADLFPPKGSQGMFGPTGSMFDMSTGPIAFPGWPDRMNDRPITREQQPGVSMTSPWFFGNVKAIAGEAGVLELEVKERAGDGDQEELTPVANHPLEKLWLKPNPFMGHTFVMQYWVWQMYLFGKGFFYFAPDSRSKELLEMWPVPSVKIRPIGSRDKFIEYYEYKVSRENVIKIPPELICYSRFINPFDPLDGLPPLVAAFNGIETDLAMARWNANFFGPENAIPTAIATLSDSTSDTDFKLIRQDLLDNFGKGKRKLLVTRGDDINFNVLQFNPEQMMFDKLREISRMEIDRACGLPDGFWTSRANRANSEHADSVIVNTIIWPLGVGLSEDMNAQIVDRHYGEQFKSEFKDVRTRNIAQELSEFQAVTSIYTIAELRMMRPAPEVTKAGWINGDKDDPRNNLLVAQVAQGMGKPEEEAKPEAEVNPTEEADVDEEPVEEEEVETTEDESGEEVAPIEEVTKALSLWRAKSIKRLRAGRGAACAFKSEALPEPVAARIEGLLATCESAEAIRDLFNCIKVVELPSTHTGLFDANMFGVPQSAIKYSDDQPRNDDGTFGSGGSTDMGSRSIGKLGTLTGDIADAWMMDYTEINDKARLNIPDSRVSQIQSAMRGKTVPKGQKLFRGISLDPDDPGHAHILNNILKPGGSLRGQGFSSASLNQSDAEDFAKGGDDGNSPVVFELTSDGTAEGVNIGSGLGEVIVQDNAYFNVRSVSKKGGVIRVKAELSAWSG